MIAGTTFAHFECDLCHALLGETGRVIRDDEGLVLEAECEGCYKPGDAIGDARTHKEGHDGS